MKPLLIVVASFGCSVHICTYMSIIHIPLLSGTCIWLFNVQCNFGILAFTQLEYDILEYVVIERLAQGGREKLKDDGLNLSDWLQSLASFWGHLYVSFSSFLTSISDCILLFILKHVPGLIFNISPLYLYY